MRQYVAVICLLTTAASCLARGEAWHSPSVVVFNGVFAAQAVLLAIAASRASGYVGPIVILCAGAMLATAQFFVFLYRGQWPDILEGQVYFWDWPDSFRVSCYRSTMTMLLVYGCLKLAAARKTLFAQSRFAEFFVSFKRLQIRLLHLILLAAVVALFVKFGRLRTPEINRRWPWLPEFNLYLQNAGIEVVIAIGALWIGRESRRTIVRLAAILGFAAAVSLVQPYYYLSAWPDYAASLAIAWLQVAFLFVPIVWLLPRAEKPFDLELTTTQIA